MPIDHVLLRELSLAKVVRHQVRSMHRILVLTGHSISMSKAVTDCELERESGALVQRISLKKSLRTSLHLLCCCESTIKRNWRSTCEPTVRDMMAEESKSSHVRFDDSHAN